ncbi:MAG TPA: hypothetical protein VK745_26390 [Polyangiaceae bacterium]|jgi:hypothetical protein|nr:hypothetical protein [Polyangiaceae bacterium]
MSSRRAFFMRTACALLLLSAVDLGGCSDKTHGSSSSVAPCSVQFSGNTSSSVTEPSCSALSVTEDAGMPDYSLNFQVRTPQVPSFGIAIDLGPAPSPGAFSSETTSNWSVTGSTATSCAFLAGSAAARVGSFTLTITSLALSGASSVATDAADANTADANTSDAATTEARATEAGATDASVAGKLHGTLDLTAYVEETPGMACGISDAEVVHIDF